MELKQYQQTVIDDLTRFVALLNETSGISEAYRRFWAEKKVRVSALDGLPPYQDILSGVPNVCLKVPTGGGKTFIAACALNPIFDGLPYTKTKAVVWLVPSDAILEQTVKALSDPHHPYRRRINTDFSNRVEVYTKTQLLSGQNFSPAVVNEQLSIFALSYDSFRTSKKEGRKAYQENGNLAPFARYMNDMSILLSDTDETALIQVIRFLNPIVIVDESHHAGTPLSREMLMNFNPCFALSLTATPGKESNIISYADAMQLKKENMVKLPVIVNNLHTRDDVFMEAISARRKLEAEANREKTRTGRYIRPIALLQAEPRGNDTTTFDKVRQILLELNIPENHIAVKTADRNELRGVNLLLEDCPVRYIITINALKEGWDCPFAYVLATIANRSSAVDVEQILGRILRLPHATKNESGLLNISYVVTSSNDFHATVQRVIAGLNNAGFSDRDYRVGSAEEDGLQPQSSGAQLPIFNPDMDAADDISVNVEAVKSRLAASGETDISGDELFRRAMEQASQYENAVAQCDDRDYAEAPLEVRGYMNLYNLCEEFAEEAAGIRLPQFAVPSKLPLFGESGKKALDKEMLIDGFILRDKDTLIDFSVIESHLARIDVTDAGSVPKMWKLTEMENRFFSEFFSAQPPEKQVEYCRQMISKRLLKNNCVDSAEMSEYVGRIISGFTTAQLDSLLQAPGAYLDKISKKIDSLLDAYRERIFDLWVEQGKISCEPLFRLKSAISLTMPLATLPKSLYMAEENMNGLEFDVAFEISNLKNIRWWHRNIARTGFNINGCVHAYPDIIAMTKSSKILMIEPKGDHLENAESRRKVKIGRIWQNMAGSMYRYYMVFRDKDLNVDGAVRFERFMEIVKGL